MSSKMNIRISQEIMKDKDLYDKFTSGHRLCAGCGIPAIVKAILSASDKQVIAANATGCLEVATTIYPYSSWGIPWIHNTFENAAATMSGVETAYRALKERGKLTEEFNFVAFGGDGGTYDIGLQSLSGALERGHRFLYVTYNNEGYMNTGHQRSGASPLGSSTTTTPAGSKIPGKTLWRKDLTEIVAGHNIRYVAQTATHLADDIYQKAKKAFAINGPTFMNVLMPCTTNWHFEPNLTMEISRLAVDTLYWPIYEIEDGIYKINYKPKKVKPIEQFLKTQRRFKHLFKKENMHIIDKIQKEVLHNWERLLVLEEATQKNKERLLAKV